MSNTIEGLNALPPIYETAGSNTLTPAYPGIDDAPPPILSVTCDSSIITCDSTTITCDAT